MPPRPRHSRISSCGKCGAICSGGNGGCADVAFAASPVKTVSVFRFNAMRHRGHNPAGALGGRGAPHCGQFVIGSVSMPVTNRWPRVVTGEFQPRNTNESHERGSRKTVGVSWFHTCRCGRTSFPPIFVSFRVFRGSSQTHYRARAAARWRNSASTSAPSARVCEISSR